MAMIHITKKQVREMKKTEALELLANGTIAHMKGASCGPGRAIPEGTERQRYAIAVAWAYKRIYGRDVSDGYRNVVYWEDKDTKKRSRKEIVNDENLETLRIIEKHAGK